MGRQCQKYTISRMFDLFLSHFAGTPQNLPLSYFLFGVNLGTVALDRANGRGGFGSQTAAEPPPPDDLGDP